MRGLYIIGTDVVRYPNYVGVRNKIKGQINAFTQLNVNVDYIDLNNDKIILNNTKEIKDLKKYKKTTIIVNMFYYSLIHLKEIDMNEYDFIYIRFALGNLGCFKLIKYLNKINKKIFIEVPTYPYQNEIYPNITNRILLKIDKYIWNRYQKYVHRVVLTNDMKYLHNIKAINIFNGIDLNSVTLKSTIKKSSIINLIAVANISKWHGYDRVIKGLYKYYLKNNDIIVKLLLVGEGDEKPKLEKLTRKLGLGDYVEFLGIKKGKELDNIFDIADIGISSLALFRAGGGHDPIKSKEYIGRGIPVVVGYKDRAFKEELPFVFEFEESEDEIDINEIIHRYYALKYTPSQIRDYAQKHLSWKSQMFKVISEV